MSSRLLKKVLIPMDEQIGALCAATMPTMLLSSLSECLCFFFGKFSVLNVRLYLKVKTKLIKILKILLKYQQKIKIKIFKLIKIGKLKKNFFQALSRRCPPSRRSPCTRPPPFASTSASSSPSSSASLCGTLAARQPVARSFPAASGLLRRRKNGSGGGHP
jgi:hypothetical protein